MTSSRPAGHRSAKRAVNSLSPTTRSCFPLASRANFGLADLWRHGPTANRRQPLLLPRSAAGSNGMSLDLDAVAAKVSMGSPLASENSHRHQSRADPRAASISSQAGLETDWTARRSPNFRRSKRYVLYKNSDPPPQPAPAQVPQACFHDRHRHQLRSLSRQKILEPVSAPSAV